MDARQRRDRAAAEDRPSCPARASGSFRYLTGPFVTSLEMAGCSISVRATDAATLALWDAPVHTAALRWGV